MNWIKKVLNIGEKIKKVIKKRPTKEKMLKKAIGLHVVRAQF